MKKPVSILPLVALVAACATNEPGWTGSGAMPFDSALAECRAQAAGIAVEAQREAALESCMAAKGWTRD